MGLLNGIIKCSISACEGSLNNCFVCPRIGLHHSLCSQSIALRIHPLPQEICLLCFDNMVDQFQSREGFENLFHYLGDHSPLVMMHPGWQHQHWKHNIVYSVRLEKLCKQIHVISQIKFGK